MHPTPDPAPNRPVRPPAVVYCFVLLSPQVVSTEWNGRTYYVDEVDEEKRPFKALLDVGIRSTSTGWVFVCV